MSGEESPALIAGDSSLFLARFQSDNSRSWQGSPKTIVSPSVLSSSFDAVEGDQIFSSRCFGLSWVWGSVFDVLMMISARLGNDVRLSRSHGSRSMKDGRWWRRLRRRTLTVVLWAAVVGLFFLLNLLMFRRLQHGPSARQEVLSDALNATLQALPMPQFGGKSISYEKVRMPRQVMYSRLLTLATHSLADEKSEPRDLWKETLMPSIPWKPCADQRSWEPSEGTNGYILVSANGGISQQRVAICNAVAIARLLNSTLVLPQFLYSSVWQDSSQFSDIYNAEHFINHLKDDIKIVKELPVELQSLDLEAIGSLVSSHLKRQILCNHPLKML
ncbi:hypothetical protein HPP92_026256 [Vanilla planifolia]|uniref:O-fucosyltransferase family protein n=1 Tax=Vanilla planifolia TaxID=51239 RepID=A0A835U9T6_VANPL|nr:hypothetical protein HPP92_026256 [Vanilla planifolia]